MEDGKLLLKKKNLKQGVFQSHCGLAIYINRYLKAKEEYNYGNSNFFTM
jgi:hypothetical protein